MNMNEWLQRSFGILTMMVLWSLTLAVALAAGDSLPKIGPAPEFALTNQDGKRLALNRIEGFHVRDTGIEPVLSVWKTDVLPLN